MTEHETKGDRDTENDNTVESQNAEMNAELEQLRTQCDELDGRLKRALADIQNTQRRAAIEQQQAREHGKVSVIDRLLPVLDQFDMALSQGLMQGDAEAISKGVRLIRDELMRAVQSTGVTIVAPQANDEFDPSRHEAMTHQPMEGLEPGRVAATYRFGYVMGERLIRPAQVTIVSQPAAASQAQSGSQSTPSQTDPD